MPTKSKSKSKPKKKTSNVERLESAGVLVSEQYTDDDKRTVEKLSATEVGVLIKMRKKRGSAPEGKHHLRPNVFV
ncbi:MAG: hypothetical protein WAK91_01425 [Candidatus Acidiferrales bacterium]|jgi:hypothetical protein